MILLVAGAKRVDAGKTTVATGLVAHADATGFKPRAGNDYWHSHDDCLTAVDDGRLYGKDAHRLAAASPDQPEPEAINAVHRLWRPSPGGGTGILGREDREFIVDRVGEQYVRNATVELPTPVREGLSLDDATAVDSLPALNEVMDGLHVPALAALREEVTAAERAVVESYGDVARPIRDLAPDAVAVVEPGRVRLYDGDRYANACDVAPGAQHDGRLEQRVSSVVDLLEPAATRRLDPLPADRRTDPAAVAAAYADVYERLVDLARAG